MNIKTLGLIASGFALGSLLTFCFLKSGSSLEFRNHQIGAIATRLKHLDKYLMDHPAEQRKYIGSISASRNVDEFYIILVDHKSREAPDAIARPLFLQITPEGKIIRQGNVDDEFQRAIRVLPPKQ